MVVTAADVLGFAGQLAPRCLVGVARGFFVDARRRALGLNGAIFAAMTHVLLRSRTHSHVQPVQQACWFLFRSGRTNC